LTFTRLVNVKAWCFKCEGFEHYDYQCPSKSQHDSIIPSGDVDDSKIVEYVHIPSKTTSIIEDVSVGFDTPIIDEGYASYEGNSKVLVTIVESDTTLTVDTVVYDH